MELFKPGFRSLFRKKLIMQNIDLPSGARLDFSDAPLVMAIVNCTEDSFYPGSRNFSSDGAIANALRAEENGASIIDFGAESSRPGAAYIDREEELRKLIPVIKGFRARSSLPVSVDTRKSGVAECAIDSGADIINDISSLEDDPKIGSLCARSGAAVVLMHKKGIPESMQNKPYYTDVVKEVTDYLENAALRAVGFGIDRSKIILDPGIGFGKRVEDNLDLIARFDNISALGYHSLMALSRKNFIGVITGRNVDERLSGTIAANAFSLHHGAEIIRVHDVPEAVDMVKMYKALVLHA